MFIKRLLGPAIEDASRHFPVVMVTGPRQTGKTTLLTHLDPKRRFVTLDDMDLRRLAIEEPKLFLERFPPPAFIDEFQYAPQILPYIKIAVDEKRKRMKPCRGEYWLSGSQNFVLMTNVQESLAGRVAMFDLLGLNREEMGPTNGPREGQPFFERPAVSAGKGGPVAKIFSVLLRGDKPSLWTDPKLNRDRYYSSYIQTYLERDVRQILGVEHLPSFEKFMRVLAGRAGQMLNMAALASDVGITIPTVKSWLSVLERSFQIYLLQPYFQSFRKRLIKSPKMYFLDTGLAAYLLKWSDARTALAGPMAGSLFENWVVSEVIKSYRHRGLDPRLYYWRTREGREIDLIRDAGGKLHPAEIKLSASPDGRTFIDCLENLKRAGAPMGQGKIICGAREPRPLNRQIEIIPASFL